MIQSMLRAITAKFHLNAITLGEFTRMKINSTEFQLWAFHAGGLGHVSAISSGGPLGLTKTESLTITPTERDMPLFSYHRVHTVGSDTLKCQLFDTLLEQADMSWAGEIKAKYDLQISQATENANALPESLCIKGKKAQSQSLDNFVMEYLNAFLEAAEAAPYCDPAAKKEKASACVEAHLRSGGPTVNLFIKGMGSEKTEFLLRNFIFGTSR